MVRITLSLVTQSKHAAHCGLDTLALCRLQKAEQCKQVQQSG